MFEVLRHRPFGDCCSLFLNCSRIEGAKAQEITGTLYKPTDYSYKTFNTVENNSLTSLLNSGQAIGQSSATYYCASNLK